LKGHQLREASKVKTWLFTTLYREFLGKKRQDDHFVETDEEELLAEPVHIDSTLVNQLDAGLVQKAMHQLNEKFRAPLALFYLEQHSYREIAEILALPIGTVMSRISRGKAELRKQLADAADSQARKVVRWKEGS
jgi:RNA polymerase sigma-70 factor (ECF subfamily)